MCKLRGSRHGLIFAVFVVYLGLSLVLSKAAIAIGPGYSVEPTGSGEVYYLDAADGNDDHVGTSRDKAWKTLEKAGNAAEAGDTVILLDGTYPGILQPNSGEPGKPITFLAANRLGAKLIGKPGAESRHWALDLSEGQDHLVIKGFHLQPAKPLMGRWVELDGCTDIVLRDLLVEGAANSGTTAPLAIADSKRIRLFDSVVRERAYSNLAEVANTKDILIEGCTFGLAGHIQLGFAVDGGSRRVVIRGNVFQSGTGRMGPSFWKTPQVLMEQNIFTHAYHGFLSATSNNKTYQKSGVIRFNRSFRNWGPHFKMNGVTLGDGKVKAYARHIRIYNNVFDDNYAQAVKIVGDRQNKQSIRDNIFKNNIFSRNNRHGDIQHLDLNMDRGNEVQFTHNNFYTGNDKYGIDDDGKARSVTGADRDTRYFSGNMNVKPGFKKPDIYNHALSTNSAMRNRAAPLTETTSAGSGQVVEVDDARWFYPGYDAIPGEQGDRISIGGKTTRITNVDLENNTLTLAASRGWQKGESVGFPHSEKASDMGAYEHGRRGRVSVQVLKNRFRVEPGQPVQFTAKVRGDVEPKQFVWRFSDGQIARGRQVTVRFPKVRSYYPSPRGFSAICRVVDKNGEHHLGTGYVEVTPNMGGTDQYIRTNYNGPALPDADGIHRIPEISNTREIWDPDFNWWWAWYSTRSWFIYTVGGGELFSGEKEIHNGMFHIWCDEPGQRLPLRIEPANLDLQKWDTWRVRYRIAPGTATSVYLEGFMRTRDGEYFHPRVFVAQTSADSPPEKQKLNDIRTLKNDGQWHTIEIDLTAIRKKYPDIRYLRRIGFEAYDYGAVKPGQEYWVDWHEIVDRSEE